MTSTPACRSCGAPILGVAIEGFCPRCLAATAFKLGDDSGDPAGEGGRWLGDFELFEEIGRGGMGVVYRARQLGLRRDVALKVLRAGPFATADEIARFRREAETAAGLQHPHIVAIHTVGEADGHLYFSMDLVAGRTLAELTMDGPLEPRRAAGYVALIAEAINAAHAQGVLHRDLKPGNIIIDREDRPRITDFGLARWLEVNADAATLTQSIAGSPGYMPPEQADPQRGPVSVAADVYSLGALLYHLLAGRPPFAAATPTSTMLQVLNDEPAALRRLNSTVPRDLETICLKCLNKEPNRRYTSAGSLAADLGAFLENRPITARPVRAWERTALWLRRHPALTGLGAALLLAIALGIGGVFWQWQVNRSNLYAADLRVASEAIELGNLGRARELLELHRPAEGTGDFAWRLLRARAEGDPRSLIGFHPWIVDAVAWSPDGKHLASASVSSGTVKADIRIWNPATPGANPIILDLDGARDLFWFPDNRRLLATHFESDANIWDVIEMRVLETLPGRSAGLSLDGQWLMTCTADPFAWNRDKPTGPVQLRNRITGESRRLADARFAALSPSGRWVATTDFRGIISLHDRDDETPVRQLKTDLTIWAMAFSPDESQLVVTGFGNDALVWNLNDSSPDPMRLTGHTLNLWKATFSPDGKTLITTSSDQTLKLWDAKTGGLQVTLHGHGSEVWCAAFSPDGRAIASGGKDRAVFVWPTHSPKPELEFKALGYPRPVFAADSGAIITHAPDDTGNYQVHTLHTETPSHGVTLNGQPLAFTGSDGELLGVEGTFKLRRTSLRDPAHSTTVELSHEPNEVPPGFWTASPDGEHVAGLAAGGALSLWSARTGARTKRSNVPGVTPVALHLSPNLSWVAITAGEQGFWLCSLTDGSMRQLTGHLDQGKFAAFSPDSRRLATASVDAVVKLWDVHSGKSTLTLRGHRTEASAVAFAPDGEILASCETGGGLRLWHLPTRREIAVIALPAAADWICFAPDGHALAVMLSNGRILVLNAP